MKNTFYYLIITLFVSIVLASGCTNSPTGTSTSTTSVPTSGSVTAPITTTFTTVQLMTVAATSQSTSPLASSNSITLTSVPSIGSYEYLKGTARVQDPSKFKVVVYIFVSGWWGPKPQWDKPLTDINVDGTWSTNIVTGGSDTHATKITAFLVPAGYKPANMKGEQQLPSDLNQFISVTVER